MRLRMSPVDRVPAVLAPPVALLTGKAAAAASLGFFLGLGVATQDARLITGEFGTRMRSRASGRIYCRLPLVPKFNAGG